MKCISLKCLTTDLLYVVLLEHFPKIEIWTLLASSKARTARSRPSYCLHQTLFGFLFVQMEEEKKKKHFHP